MMGPLTRMLLWALLSLAWASVSESANNTTLVENCTCSCVRPDIPTDQEELKEFVEKENEKIQEELSVDKTLAIHKTDFRKRDNFNAAYNRCAISEKIRRYRIPTSLKTLSSTVRKKTSAKDDRPSAKNVGYMGIVLLALAGSVVIIMDADYFVKIIHTIATKLFKKKAA